MKSIIAGVILFALSGCAAFQPPPDCVDRGDGLCWKVNPSQIPVGWFEWEVDTEENAAARCGNDTPFEDTSCMMWRTSKGVCLIVSSLTLEEAKRTPIKTPLAPMGRITTVAQHELEHCGLGPDHIAWLHSSTRVRKLLP